MNKFAFTINTSNTLDLDALQRDKVREVMDRVPSYKLCIGCGACTATCTAGQFVNYNIRRNHLSFCHGKYDQVETQLQNCMLCGKCTLVCPRGVNLRALIINMRRVLHG